MVIELNQLKSKYNPKQFSNKLVFQPLLVHVVKHNADYDDAGDDDGNRDNEP